MLEKQAEQPPLLSPMSFSLPAGNPLGYDSEVEFHSTTMQNVMVTGKGKRKGAVPSRIYFLLARKAPVALIFRRGPSKWVQLIKWNTQTDKFECGQWLHGRIYERRGDLSPDGSLLVYFCAKWNGRRIEEAEQMLDKKHAGYGVDTVRALLKRKPKVRTEYTYSWTAVSRAPYFTALALWPKGDCWHGGGLFKSNRLLWLNHKPEVAVPHRDHQPTGLSVEPNPAACGEDDPIYSMRLERDGWRLKQEWQVENRGYPKLFLTVRPEIREKTSPNGEHALRLIRSISVLDYSEEFSIASVGAGSTTTLERASWADFDQQGRLVFARDGKILAAEFGPGHSILERELVDLNGSVPVSLPCPDWARAW